MFRDTTITIHFLFVCVEVLQPSQPNVVMSKSLSEFTMLLKLVISNQPCPVYFQSDTVIILNNPNFLSGLVT